MNSTISLSKTNGKRFAILTKDSNPIHDYEQTPNPIAPLFYLFSLVYARSPRRMSGFSFAVSRQVPLDSTLELQLEKESNNITPQIFSDQTPIFSRSSVIYDAVNEPLHIFAPGYNYTLEHSCVQEFSELLELSAKDSLPALAVSLSSNALIQNLESLHRVAVYGSNTFTFFEGLYDLNEENAIVICPRTTVSKRGASSVIVAYNKKDHRQLYQGENKVIFV